MLTETVSKWMGDCIQDSVPGCGKSEGDVEEGMTLKHNDGDLACCGYVGARGTNRTMRGTVGCREVGASWRTYQREQ